jgi:hypothetical protein
VGRLKTVTAFIWRMVENMTTSWHDGAGVVAVAGSIERAKELVEAAREKGHKTDGIAIGPPDATFEAVPGTPEQVHVFPDAGCC